MNIEEFSKEADETKKICPLLSINSEGWCHCKESDCGFWNEKYQACGLRLAVNREGREK